MNQIRLVIFDIDGVFTDNSVYVDSHGEEFYRFNKRDGKGIELLKESGVSMIAITSEKFNESVKARMEKLGIHYVYDVKDKKSRILDDHILLDYNYEEIAFIGDDVQDVELLKEVGTACCPNDAHLSVLGIPGIKRMNADGGKGVVREFADYVIKVNHLSGDSTIGENL